MVQKTPRGNFSFSMIGLTIGLVFGTASSAHALPGQSVSTVVQWAKKHSFLPPFKRGIGELSGIPFYTTEAKVETGIIRLSMNPADHRDRQVGTETIVYQTQGTPSELVFTRTNTQGLKFIQRVYDRSIADDFRRSKYVAQIDFIPYRKRFYRGQRFAYITTEFNLPNQDEQSYHLEILPLKSLDREIAADRQCRQQSAEGCGD